MDFGPDEVAGVVDLFGALTRHELQEGLAELAYKQGAEHDPGAFAAVVEDALRSYHLVAVPVAEAGLDGPSEADAETVLVAGPVAFPELPANATDLPHILDAPERDVSREAAGAAAEQRFREDAASAVEAGDDERVAELLDVSYELEVWAPVDLGGARDRLDDAGE